MQIVQNADRATQQPWLIRRPDQAQRRFGSSQHPFRSGVTLFLGPAYWRRNFETITLSRDATFDHKEQPPEKCFRVVRVFRGKQQTESTTGPKPNRPITRLTSPRFALPFLPG